MSDEIEAMIVDVARNNEEERLPRLVVGNVRRAVRLFRLFGRLLESGCFDLDHSDIATS